MNGLVTLAVREYRAYFLSATGYVVAFLFLLLTGAVFIAQAFQQDAVASLRPVFTSGTWLLLFIAPAVTMRMLSEEFRLGTYEMLATCPLRERTIVLAKYAASLGVLITLLAPTALYVVALEQYGRPDYGELACGYAGLVLAGAAYLAVGLAASALTSSQVVAYLGALFFWLALSLGSSLAAPLVNDPWSDLIAACSPDPRLRDFAIGLVDSANVVYFLAFVAAALPAAVAALQWRRIR